MTRDNKGRFAPEHVEMTDEQREAICYKSKLLNKYYDDYDEMVKEETAFKAEQAAKEEAVNTKREDAKKVEEAYKETLKVRKEANELIRAADQKYFKLRNEFIDKYHAFHMTYTDKEGDSNLSVDTNATNDMIKLIDWLWKF